MRRYLCINCGKSTQNAQAMASMSKDKCDDEILKNAIKVDKNKAWFALCRKCEIKLIEVEE